MTRSTHVPKHNPPSLWDRVLTHTMEICVAIITAVAGLKLFWAVWVAGTDDSRADELHGMPPLLLLLVGVVLLAGSFMAILALNWRALHDMGRGWALERFGWSLVIAGLLSYSVAVLSYFPEGMLDLPRNWIIVVAAVIRIVALRGIERRVRGVKHQLGTGGPE